MDSRSADRKRGSILEKERADKTGHERTERRRLDRAKICDEFHTIKTQIKIATRYPCKSDNDRTMMPTKALGNPNVKSIYLVMENDLNLW